jgi:hypothetical protein
LLGFGAAEPDEMATVVVSIRSGIKGVTAIDEGDWEITLLIEEFANDQRGSSWFVWRDDFAKMTGGEL